jgi:hypothetical protein
VKHVLVLLAVLGLTAGGPWVATASAAIHEIVAAYCSGGGVGTIDDSGFLEPPGVTDLTRSNFAKPVIATGALDFPFVTDKPNGKYEEGTNAITGLGADTVDHPSAEHCPGAEALP